MTLDDTTLVRAVLAIVDDGAAYDGAIEALVAAERRHGVRIVLEERTGSLAGTFAPVDPRRRPTIREFRELMALWSADPAERAAYEQAWARWYRVGGDGDAPDEQLFPFISETGLLLGGTDFANDHWIEFPSGAVSSWTQRAWGGLLARWAVATGWRPERRDEWAGTMGYAIFTFYLYTELERYEEWCKAMLEVIRRKCERELDG